MNEPKLGWSWGAFMFNYLWGFGNKAYQVFWGILFVILASFSSSDVAVLSIIGCIASIIVFVWAIICGVMGKKWAWKDGKGLYSTADEFNASMRSWDRAGILSFILVLIIVVIVVILAVAGLAIIGSDPNALVIFKRNCFKHAVI